MLLLIYLVTSISIGLLAFGLLPSVRAKVEASLSRRSEKTKQEMSVMFMETSPQRLWIAHLVSPLLVAGLGWLIMQNVAAAGAGAAVGLVLPGLWVGMLKARRRKQFNAQLVDALMMLTSSLKAGLSVLQGFEVLVEEMGPPMSQEIGLVFKEVKMGISFEAALEHLKQRIPSEDLALIVTSILVSRETAGDVTAVFSRLVETIRARQKVKENITTLSLMPRMQGLIGSFTRLLRQETGEKSMRKSLPALAIAAIGIAGCGGSSHEASSSATRPQGSATPFLASLKQAKTVASTVPANGDINPYGIVLVPSTLGKEVAGRFLISNFNDKANNQGTGTTIDQISASGTRSLFATIDPRALPGSCPGGVGLNTALSMLPGGYVVVGSLPTTNGKSATAKYGCLIVLDSNGHPVSTIAGKQIQGPWDMTSATQGSTTTLFVSMVLNGGAKDVTVEVHADGVLSDTSGFGVSTSVILHTGDVFTLKPEDTSSGGLKMVQGHCTVIVTKGAAKTVRGSACQFDSTTSTCVVHAEAH